MLTITKFPIKIDLSEFFEDERKLVLLLVDPDWDNIAGLQRRVHKLFNVGSVSFTTTDNYYIPPSESIEMLHYLDIIKAFKPTQLITQIKLNNELTTLSDPSEQIKSNLHSLAGIPNSNNQSDIGTQQVKRTKNISTPELTNMSPPPSPNKRLLYATPQISPGQIVLPAKIITADNSTYNYCGTILAEDLFKSCTNDNNEDNKINNNEKLPPIEIMDVNMDIDEQNSLLEVSTTEKSKRKRNKKNKKDAEINRPDGTVENTVNSNKEHPDTQNSSTVSDELQTRGKNKNNKVKKAKDKEKHDNKQLQSEKTKNNNHRYFNEDGELLPATNDDANAQNSSVSNSTPSKVVFFCTLEDFNTERPRIFNVAEERLNNQHSKKKQSSPQKVEIIDNQIIIAGKDADNTNETNLTSTMNDEHCGGGDNAVKFQKPDIKTKLPNSPQCNMNSTIKSDTDDKEVPDDLTLSNIVIDIDDSYTGVNTNSENNSCEDSLQIDSSNNTTVNSAIVVDSKETFVDESNTIFKDSMEGM